MKYTISEIQEVLRDEKVDGWLLYNFRNINPIAKSILSLPPEIMVTRRYFYLIPSYGQPRKLIHKIEANNFDSLPGETLLYASWFSLEDGLRTLLSDIHSVAMEYSPYCSIPTVSVVDAGTFELVKKFNVDIHSSATLVQYFEARWSNEQFRLHQEAAEHLRKIIDEVFRYIRSSISNSTEITEYDIQQFILSEFKKRNLITASPPNCSVNENSANPHYEPMNEGSKRIQAGDFVLVDIWAKSSKPKSVYADITWVGYVGDSVPEKYHNVFEVVKKGRDSALNFVRNQLRAGIDVRGYEVDTIARTIIRSAGYGEYFIHRTGHSLGEDVHGNGANLDNLETHDERKIIPRTAFTIEPGIYLPGDFGVRSEINVYVTDEKECIVTGLPIQESIIPILR